MKTTLETFVGYLSGRGGVSAVPLGRSLDDPNSDTSRWLAEVRDRTRAMFDAGPAGRLGFPFPDEPPADSRPFPSPAAARAALAAFAVAALLLVAVATAWWGQAARLRRLEAELALRDGHWRDEVARLESAIRGRDKPAAAKDPARPAVARIPAPAAAPAPSARERAPELLLARLEAGLARLDRRLAESEELTTPTAPPETTPTEQLRQDLEGMKRDVEARDRDLRQNLREMRAALQGVVQYLQQSAVIQQGMLQGGLQMPYQLPSTVLPGVVSPGVGVGAGNPALHGGAAPHAGQGVIPAHPGAGAAGHPANSGHSK